MSHRLAIAVWSCCGLAPLWAGYSAPPTSPAVWLVWSAWLAGWPCLWWATRQSTRRQLLAAFAQTRIAQLVALSWLAIGLWGLFQVGGSSGLLLALTPPLGVLALWATSGDLRQLQRRAAGSLCAASSLALSAAGLELTLRWAHAQRPENDYRTVTWGHRVTTNRLGFREREVRIPKPAGSYRVMVLGDSFTWGAGLALDERYTNLVEQELQRRFPTRGVEVLNFGQPSTPTSVQDRTLGALIERVDPDRVVVGFCINDPQPRAQSYAVELERYHWLFLGIDALGRGQLAHTQRFLKTHGDQLLRNTGRVPQWWVALDRVYQPSSTAWNEFVTALVSIKERCGARDLPPPLFVALWYGRGDFNRPDTRLRLITKWCRQATAAAQQIGFETVDMEPAFRRQGDRDRWVNAWDGHPSAECNRIYARHIVRHLAPPLKATAAR